MGPLTPLTEAERERIYQGKLQRKTESEIAAALERSVEVVHKWCQRIRQEGLAGLRTRRRGPTPQGVLSRFDPLMAQTALSLKRSHPRWGPDRVLVEMGQDARFRGQVLPDRSRLSVFFRAKCPECVAASSPRSPKPSAPPLATAVHEVWQLDNQEKIELRDGEIAVICNVHDPYGAAMIASRAFAAKTEKHWRKLDWTEIRQVFRDGFIEWRTLPDSVLTDNELVLSGSPGDPFPSKLTLWLRGLGIKHNRIRPHCPTDQPQVERGHRTLDNFTLDDESRANVENLQRGLDRERHTYNQYFPSRASDCAGHPPLVAHPELLHPRRPYPPGGEVALFDLQRVFDYLAEGAFQRHVSSTGIISLGRQLYSVGRPQAGKIVQVHCDATTHEWVCCEKVKDNDPAIDRELARRPIKGMTVEALTGLSLQALILEQPVQLTLPCLAP